MDSEAPPSLHGENSSRAELRRRRNMTPAVRYLTLLMLALAAAAGVVPADQGAGPVLKTEPFDRDPGWEGHNNHLTPRVNKTVKQDFGYSLTNFAGNAKGEIGGTLWRSPTRTYYAAKTPTRTLDDTLSASGTFAVTA